MEPFNLLTTERQLLALGNKILLAIKGDLPDEMYDAEHTLKTIKSLEQGYVAEYPNAPEELYFDDCKFVWDILDMFRDLHLSTDSLDEKISDETLEQTKFQGFDYQDEKESQLAGYTEHLIETGRWKEVLDTVEGTDFNSHSPMLPTYRAMLEEYQNLAHKKGKLTKEQIVQIVSASSTE